MSQPETRSAGTTGGWLARGALALGSALLTLRIVLPTQAALESISAEASSEQLGRGYPGEPPSREARRAGHETEDMDATLMVRLALGLGATVLVVVFLMVGFRLFFTSTLQASRPQLTTVQTTQAEPPLPHLQANPVQELADYNAAQNALLHSYGWVDPAHTRARIPIDRASSLILGHPLDTAP